MGNIICITYNYFELEGIPPYPSPFIPVDYKYDWWIDKTNTKRFRFEKRFATRSSPAKSGLMVLTTSAGAESKILHTEIWNNKRITIEKDQPISNSAYTDWYETFTAMGRKLVKGIEQKSPSHTYLGEQIDGMWGNCHVFQTNEIVQSSDLYFNLPLGYL